MSIASVLQDTKARLDSLLEYANETTGQSDASIGDAIRTLTDGYGGGGGGVVRGSFEYSTYLGYMVPVEHNLGSNEYLFFYWLDDETIESLPTNASLYVVRGICSYGVDWSEFGKSIYPHVFQRLRKNDSYTDIVSSNTANSTNSSDNKYSIPFPTYLPIGTVVNYIAIPLTGGFGGNV